MIYKYRLLTFLLAVAGAISLSIMAVGDIAMEGSLSADNKNFTMSVSDKKATTPNEQLNN